MVFLGLVCTSAGFFIPAYLAHRRKKRLDTVASVALATTSLLFHTTLNPTIKIVDMAIAHGTGIYSMVRCALKWRKNHQLLDACGVAATPTCALIFYGISKGRDGLLARCGHMGMHLTAITFWIIYIV